MGLGFRCGQLIFLPVSILSNTIKAAVLIDFFRHHKTYKFTVLKIVLICIIIVIGIRNAASLYVINRFMFNEAAFLLKDYRACNYVKSFSVCSRDIIVTVL